MSQENVEVVRRCNRFWGERDFVQSSELFDPEVVIDFSQNVFNPGVYHGYEGLMRSSRQSMRCGIRWSKQRKSSMRAKPSLRLSSCPAEEAAAGSPLGCGSSKSGPCATGGCCG